MLSPIRNFSFLHYSYAENPETNSTFVAFHNSGFAFSRRNCNKISIVPFFSPVSKHLGSDQNPDSSKERARKKSTKLKSEADGAQDLFVPRKPRRGKKSEAVAVEDFVRDSLKRTIESIRKKNSEYVPNDNEILKEKMEEDSDKDEDDEKWSNVVEEDEPYWPLDAEIGWGIRASDYFDKYKIQNVAENGEEIDWEGEMEDTWVKEINCLEWESFAFHPSPLMVLVFERYNRASDNWKVLKELEKAIKVYWNAKDCLPPRTVKIDINIERDLAYALKAKECPQLLFLRGNRILHREKEIRTADELVQMIAYFYYNAKKPSWFDAPVIFSQ